MYIFVCTSSITIIANGCHIKATQHIAPTMRPSQLTHLPFVVETVSSQTKYAVIEQTNLICCTCSNEIVA